MLINREIFSLPPYISTSWGHVVALFMQEEILVVALNDGTTIKIPRLAPEIVEKVFVAHASYLEEQNHKGNQQTRSEGIIAQMFEMPFRINCGNLEDLSMALQHNSENSDAADLPEDMLKKIGSMAKMAGLSDPKHLPKPEPHCNCVHCQILRAIHTSSDDEEILPSASPIITPFSTKASETSVSNPEENLWIVEQQDEHYYNVTHRKDANEIYKVYISDDQVGCNCGTHGCAHILAVLRSY